MRKLKTNKKSVDTMLKESPNLYKYNQILLRLMGTYKYIFNLENKNIAGFLNDNKPLKIECDYINNYWFPGIEGIVKRYIRYANRFNQKVPLKVVDSKKLKSVVETEILKVRMELMAAWTLDFKPSETDIYILNMLACHLLISRYVANELIQEYMSASEKKEIKLLLSIGKNVLGHILLEMSDPKIIEEYKKDYDKMSKIEKGEIYG